MGGNGTSPCASCKLLRRRCAKDCIFAPYFPSDDPHKFAIVHKVFGASNVSKMLQELPVHQRADAVNSLVYEASSRMNDPVYGCMGTIYYLQNQVSQLQMQLAVAQAEIHCIQMQQDPSATMPSNPAAQMVINDDLTSSSTTTDHHDHDHQHHHQSSFQLLHNLNLSHHDHDHQHHHSHSHSQYLNFASSSSDCYVTQDSFKRESFWAS
ncbi:hypothetical protein Ancab_005996 [Ancistrocladus abbreviatus]